MIQRNDGFDSPQSAVVDHLLIVIECLLIKDISLGLDTCPLNRETICRQAHLDHQINIISPAFVTIARQPRRFTEGSTGNEFGKPGIAGAVVALNLMPGRSRTPQKLASKCSHSAPFEVAVTVPSSQRKGERLGR